MRDVDQSSIDCVDVMSSCRPIVPHHPFVFSLFAMGIEGRLAVEGGVQIGGKYPSPVAHVEKLELR